MINRIWAKSSGETLAEHTIACLKAARALLRMLPLSEGEKEALEKDVLLAISMHDVGKAAAGFQRFVRGEQDNWQGKRHEAISASFASGVDDLSAAALFAILTHHKSIPSDGISQVFGCLPIEQLPLPGLETVMWKEMAQEWEDNRSLLITEWEQICHYLGWHPTTELPKLGSLRLIEAWLERGVGKTGQRRTVPFQERYYASLVRGLTIASDHLGSAHRAPPSIPELRRFNVLKKGDVLRPFQEEIGEVEGSALLRAPTGSGKTEAALLWAQKNQRTNGRLFYVLPYTASINAMHRRLADVFGARKVGLLHYRATSALYSMLETDVDRTSLLTKQQIAATLTDLAREIWFPIRVCTPHQTLRYTLRGKGWEYMLAEFPNACFIYDEVHAYDPRVVGLTLASAMLFRQWGARCLFLSATLPRFLQQLIKDALGEVPVVEPDPKKAGDKKVLDKKRHIVEVRDGSITSHINEVIEAIAECSSTLIVCNHVRTAQELFSYLKDRLPSQRVQLLHSRFNQEDRNRLESEITGGELPKVLVATQVVEVSLDIDFEQAFLEPAPIDALIQRMGRVNRFGTRSPAKVVALTKQVGPHNLYCECEGASHESTCRVQFTLNELRRIENPISERDLVEVADKVYGQGYQGADKIKFEEGLNHPDISQFEERLLAGAFQDWVKAIIEKTDQTLDVLPKCLLAKYESKKAEGLWVEANSLLVPVRTTQFAWLRPKLTKQDDLWIADLKYTHEEGLHLND